MTPTMEEIMEYLVLDKDKSSWQESTIKYFGELVKDFIPPTRKEIVENVISMRVSTMLDNIIYNRHTIYLRWSTWFASIYDSKKSFELLCEESFGYIAAAKASTAIQM